MILGPATFFFGPIILSQPPDGYKKSDFKKKSLGPKAYTTYRMSNENMSMLDMPKALQVKFKRMVKDARYRDSVRFGKIDDKLFVDAEYCVTMLCWQEGYCANCHVYLNLAGTSDSRPKEERVMAMVSIDRKDNTKMHLASNCWLTCLKCNYVRCKV